VTGCPHASQPEKIATSAGTTGNARFVNVFVGTDNPDPPVADAVTNGAGGSTFPAASAPFGAVQWGPDTPGANPAGYFHPDTQILGFSMNHLDGAGCPSERDFPVLPLVGSWDTDQTPSVGFSHAHEIASPGFYEVALDSGVTVDLTATQRTGLGQFTFPPSDNAQLAILTGWSWDIISERSVDVKVAGPHTITGSRADDFCGFRGLTTVWYVAEFDRDFTSTSTFGGQGSDTEANVAPGGMILTFDTRKNPIVRMRVGLSFVSLANAQANLAAENPGWDFNAVHSKTLARWNDYLGRVNATGGTPDQEANFYSSLYRVFLQPEVFSDVNGDYMGFDKTVHNNGRVHYANFSGWDIYRSWIQLVALLAPDETSDIMQSLVLDGQQGKGLPRWPFGDDDTGTMIGDPSDPLFANAWAFGARNFDSQAALTLMLQGANDVGAACNGMEERPDLVDWLSLHYLPVDGVEDSGGAAAATLEFAIADFSVAQFAKALGQPDTAATFMTRALNWRNEFDPNMSSMGFTGWLMGRYTHDANGAPAFVETGPASGANFREGSAYQYLFLVPHDVPGLIAALGGDDAFIARADFHFTELNAGVSEPYFYMGNEPGFEAPWEYPYAGAPWKTQSVIHRLLSTVFSPTPGGVPGNEDLGAMSSWVVWAMLGMYPEVPGVGGFVLATPSFPKIVISAPGTKPFTILADNGSADAYYLQDLKLDGQEDTSSWLPLASVTAGGTLEFSLGASPNTTWGSAAADRPPTMYP
jgi:predicted alpha-1,2-mannosidase